MSTYQLAQDTNLQTVLWGVAGAIVRTDRTARQLPTMALAASLWVYTLMITLWPDVALLGASVAKVAGVTLAIAGAVAVVAFLPVELFVGLAIVGVYAFVTFPRKTVRK